MAHRRADDADLRPGTMIQIAISAIITSTTTHDAVFVGDKGTGSVHGEGDGGEDMIIGEGEGGFDRWKDVRSVLAVLRQGSKVE